MKTVASMKYSCQISPDDWEVYRKTRICADDTTIGEIRAWANAKDGGLHLRLDDADFSDNAVRGEKA